MGKIGTHHDLDLGATYNAEAMADARRVIKETLKTSGQRVSQVDLMIENVTTSSAKLMFLIRSQ
ncbi:MAG: hypothetical protein DMF72_14550 [Acidobacteria bacterium]|nr:MAG: hypothetical protein DMF72_14550 [Acidobacteriota bacterium]